MTKLEEYSSGTSQMVKQIRLESNVKKFRQIIKTWAINGKEGFLEQKDMLTILQQYDQTFNIKDGIIQ